MDVSLINNTSTVKSIPLRNNDIADVAAVSDNKTIDKFDYSEVMMDLEEIQDFLFLLIGSDNPVRHVKGTNVNYLA